MTRAILIGVLVAIGVSGAMAQQAPKPAEVDLPVTAVVLYSSGVGFFEHTGVVEGDAVARLTFKSQQINDVLKSMVLSDLDGGKVEAVNYASRDPLVRALQSFAINLSGDPTMADLLKQLRGARVKVTAPGAPEPIEGKVLGVEFRARNLPVGNQIVAIQEPVLNLVTAGGIKSLPTQTLQSLQLDDEKLQKELSQALELLATANDNDRKTVEIRFSGKGKRKVRVGYVVETPVWKTSYRMMFGGPKPHLQGWAIVENPTDIDWTNVTLSLVSGRPISFVQDLYTPLYLTRPVVQPKLYASLTPQDYAEGMVTAEEAAPLPSRSASGPLPAAPVAKPRAGDRSQLRYSSQMEYASNVSGVAETFDKGIESAATAAKMGELFRFTIKDPVSLPRRRSAMLPIVDSDLVARRVSIYNAAVMPSNPLNGAWMDNSTGLKLMGGPVTVFTDGGYAGDAVLDNMSIGEKRLLSYAVDLDVAVSSADKTDSSITQITIVEGMLRVTRKHRYEQTYSIKNKADKDRMMLIEHPIVANRKLVSPEKPAENTDTLYRFSLDVPAGKTQDFQVVEEYVQVDVLGIIDADMTGLLWYVNNGNLSDEMKQALSKALDQRREIVELQQRLQERTARLNQIKSGQDRLRKNIETAGRDTELGRRYLAKLSGEEDQIEQLDKDIASLTETLTARQKALADYLKGLTVE